MGVALGVAGAFGVTRVIGSLLYNVTPTDPLSFAAVVALMLGVAAAAAYLPARRATQGGSDGGAARRVAGTPRRRP